MNIQAVSISIGYGDFLSATIPFNLPHLDRWVIVTDPRDTETREACRKWSLECILTEDHKRDGDSFSKGRVIERGLQHLSHNSWRLHLDADIVLPARFNDMLDAAHLQQDCIYGCDRVMVRNWEDWQKFQATGWLKTHHDYHNRLRFPDGYDVGARWGSLSAGWCPIGFFQLWHSSQDEHMGTRIKPYPSKHGSACRTDVQHALQFDRHKRILIPELIVVHVESEVSKLGANWAGRTTKPFGPPDKNPKPKPYCDGDKR